MLGLVYNVKVPEDLVISEQEAAEAAALGVSELVIQHLRDKNDASPPPDGFPKTDYYADAADSVTTQVSGGKAVVSIEKEGVALHYYGGTVLPKKKALAIPIDPSVAGIWPSEYGGEMFVVWPKGKNSGLLVGSDANDADKIGKALYRLVYKATIPSDRTVLPEDADIEKAASDAIEGAAA